MHTKCLPVSAAIHDSKCARADHTDLLSMCSPLYRQLSAHHVRGRQPPVPSSAPTCALSTKHHNQVNNNHTICNQKLTMKNSKEKHSTHNTLKKLSLTKFTNKIDQIQSHYLPKQVTTRYPHNSSCANVSYHTICTDKGTQTNLHLALLEQSFVKFQIVIHHCFWSHLGQSWMPWTFGLNFLDIFLHHAKGNNTDLNDN